jgi:hypothetical protein
MKSPKFLAITAAAALALHPTLAAAQQQACVTEEEVSAVAIYSVPSLVHGVRVGCVNELSVNGYLSRRGDALVSRYAQLQNRVWPRAKTGLLKAFAGKAGGQLGNLDMVSRLPDNAVRPLLDALIVQEVSPRIAAQDCWKVERLIEAAATVDPEIAGTILGVAVGLANPDQMPVCRRT